MGYLGNGLTITGTQNSKRIVVDATPNQTISTVTGGYLVGQLDVYRNGVKLVDTQDYTASDGASVTFLAAASEGDELEFVVFENFDVANALSNSGGTVSGDLVVTGIATFNSDVSIGGTLTYEDVTNIDSVGLITARQGIHIGPSAGVAATLTEAGGAVFTGIVTATFSGDGTGLTGVASTDNINTSTLAQFTGGVGIADSIFHIGDDNTAIRFPAADTFTVETGGTERVRVHSGGPLSVGTATTQDTFVNINPPSTHADQYVLRLRNDGDNSTKLLFANKTGGLGQIWYQEAFRFVDDADSDAERLRIDSSGRVLIGTTSDITGSSDTSIQVVHTGGGRLILGRNDSSVTDGNDLGVIGFYSNDDSSYQEAARIYAEADGTFGNDDKPGRLVFATTDDNSTQVVERLRIDSSGTIRYTGVRTGDETNKLGRFIMPSHDTNEEDVMYFQMQQEATFNQLELGGGSATYNAATQIIFRTAAIDTTTGTERLRIASSGQIGLGGANYGTAGQVITSNGSGSAPTWQDVSGGITTHVGTASGIVTSVFLGDATDHKVTVTGFVTFTATQSGTEGESHTIRIVNSGIATVGFSTYFLFPSGAAPVLPTADGAVSLISFTVHDSVGAGCTQLLAGASLNFS